LSNAIDVLPPGPIDNESLLSSDGMRPRPGLRRGDDFDCLTTAEWQGLCEVYGGGPEMSLFEGTIEVVEQKLDRRDDNELEGVGGNDDDDDDDDADDADVAAVPDTAAPLERRGSSDTPMT
jgi:hypothetical protein